MKKVIATTLLISFVACTHSATLPSSQRRVASDKTPEPITADQFLNHYHIDALHKAGWTGKGQHVAILNMDPVTDSIKKDVATYFSKVGSRMPQINFIQGSDNVAPPGAPLEVVLDIERIGLIAPDAILDVYSFNGQKDQQDVMFGKVLSSGVKIISSSIGDCEKDYLGNAHDKAVIKQVDALLEKAAADGVTILDASGDDGYACNNYKPGDPDGTSIRGWPVSNPHVTAVGATDFVANSSGGFSETGWHNSGGGASILYPVPSWQVGVVPATYKGRGIPDIAALGGSPGIQTWITIDGKPQWFKNGEGTSYAAPELAGLIALVNEGREKKGKGTIGDLNPILYTLFSKNPAQFKAVMQDIQTGDDIGNHQAKVGWDSVTGLGVPFYDKLFAYLVDY